MPMLESLFGLKGKTALVTGASKGLGLAMAKALAAAGADLVIAARSDEELVSASHEITEASQGQSQVFWINADLAIRSEADRLAREALTKAGKIDILVNNAGINAPSDIDMLKDEDWDRVIGVNLTAPMALCRALVPGMKARTWGRIINISSVFGEVSREARACYSSSKAGLIGLTKTLALELAPYKITVNAILPGPFETPLVLKLHPDPKKRQWFVDRVPLGRWGQPEELTGPLLMLAGESGSYVTGSCLTVDGGWLAQ